MKEQYKPLSFLKLAHLVAVEEPPVQDGFEILCRSF